jgi:hypothetical protein
MKPRTLLALALLLSGLGDAFGGVAAVFDWRRVAGLLARFVPDWEAQRNVVRLGLADDALHQLWANLGTALLALGIAQMVAATWVARDRHAGYDLARVIGWTLLLAGGLMAVSVPQLSSLLTESLRGLVILALALWARTALEGSSKAD